MHQLLRPVQSPPPKLLVKGRHQEFGGLAEYSVQDRKVRIEGVDERGEAGARVCS